MLLSHLLVNDCHIPTAASSAIGPPSAGLYGFPTKWNRKATASKATIIAPNDALA
jgi:hypothetical protein